MQWLIDLVIEAIGIPPVYVDRGDYQTYDFKTTDFTQDTAWHELDLSAIVPAGASAVKFHLKTRNTTVATFMRFRKHGHTGDEYRCTNRTQVSNIAFGFYLVVGVDSDRKIDYYVKTPNFTAIHITVQGWWL